MPHPGHIAAGAAAVAALMGTVAVGTYEKSMHADAPKAAKHAQSYLLSNDLPDSLTLLSGPPAANSTEMQRDLLVREAALKLKGSARYTVATLDSHRDAASTVRAFTCALGTDINSTGTPTLDRLLGFVRIDVRASAYPAKHRYQREQPFRSYHSNTCSPADEAVVQDVGSYPSARAAVGWAYALVLAQVNPSRADAILRRGRQFGESRIICDASWKSDVDAGFKLAEENVSRMRRNKQFQRDLEIARAEVASELKAGIGPPVGCELEVAALGPTDANLTTLRSQN